MVYDTTSTNVNEQTESFRFFLKHPLSIHHATNVGRFTLSIREGRNTILLFYPQLYSILSCIPIRYFVVPMRFY